MRISVSLFFVINLASAWPTTPNIFRSPLRLFSRDGVGIQATDPYDRKWIEKLTSIGDSYSVGLGAGHTVAGNNRMELNSDCYQYSYGFSNIVNMDGLFGENAVRHFQYLGCSGAKVPEIKDKHVPKMQKSQAVTLTAGGNDAHLATLLNYCVYQWATAWLWTCDGELDKAEKEVQGDAYLKDMKDLLIAIEGKLQDDNSRIYWAGYMRFFDTSTKECDDVTWAFSRNYGFRQFLTQARRTRFNKVTDMVNDKIKEACKSSKRCVYVDSEPTVDKIGGRYCMPGVNEKYYGGVNSPTDGWNRERTVFYEWSTTKDDDADGEKKIDQPEKRDMLESRAYDKLDNNTFEGAVKNWIIQGTKDQTLNVQDTKIGEVNAEGLPDWIGRVFHLTKFGNQIIAAGVIREMVNQQAIMMNQPANPITIDPGQCPLTAQGKPDDAGSKAPYSPTGGKDDEKDKCHVHVNQFHTCGADTIDLLAEVDIWDAAGDKIGHQDTERAGAESPLPVKSKLEDPLIVTGEHDGDYVQFSLGVLQFSTKDDDHKKPNWCSTGGWDPREGPACNRISIPSKRQMDCYFQCPYHGGKSSDNS